MSAIVKSAAVGLPRTDIKATLDGVELKPGFALGSWLAFSKMRKDSAMVSALSHIAVPKG